MVTKCSFNECQKYRHNKDSNWFDMNERPNYIKEYYKKNYDISHGVCPEHLVVWAKALGIGDKYKK